MNHPPTFPPPFPPPPSPALPPLPLQPRLRKPRLLPPPETACPAPLDRPLPCAVPHPAYLPPFSSPRPMFFLALALALPALGSACAELDVESIPDAGAAGAPQVSAVSPSPGTITAAASFDVSFSVPMDPSLLLADVARSETVVLVAATNAQVMSAALAHARLTASESALLIPALAKVGSDAQSIALTPQAALPAGDYALLVASRLKDATGKKLQGNGAQFIYQVAIPAMPPLLIDPLAGSSAPSNLARVRVAFSSGSPGSVLSIIGPHGQIAATAAPVDAGEAAIDLCPDPPCALLEDGASYALMLDGKPVDNGMFSAQECARIPAPAILLSTIAPRDQSAALRLALDWPARVRIVLAPDLSAPLNPASDAGPSDAGTVCTRDATSCTQPTPAFASCAPATCEDGAGASCLATIEMTGLAASMQYTATPWLTDDEGHTIVLPALKFATLAALPSASIEEVMASPPLPTPRDQGEYIELRNTGSGAIDLSLLAVQGPDGVVRSLLGTPPASPLILEPGGYAIAVGASFDPSRYSIPAGVPLLRASTQRLLSHGLADDTQPTIALVAIDPLSSTAPPIALSTFPGGTFHCPEGASIDRVHPAPAPGVPTFACGHLGGSLGGAH